MSNQKKRGRKPKTYRTADNRSIDGLTRAPDGRWRIIGTTITWRETDEAKAVAKFYELQARRTGDVPADSPLLSAAEIAKQSAERQFSLNSAQLWAYVADAIWTRPQWVAEQTGIEQIGYLRNLKKPLPLPTLDALESFWMDNAKCTVLQRKKVKRAFADFRAVAAVASLTDISRDAVVRYEKAVAERGDSGKQQSHLISGVRRVLRFYLKKSGNAATEVNDALLALSAFDASASAKTLDPKPIEIDDLSRLLGAARKSSNPQDLAMVLLMLNGAFYIGEVIDLQWEDVRDGCIVTNREKTGKCVRACVLWRETLDALAAVPRRTPFIFTNYRGEPLKVCGAQRRFRELADAAVVPVTASMLRDGAYTAAAAANVSEAICRLLVGHSSGIADAYVKRSPKMSAPATNAVYAHYFTSGAAVASAA